MNRANASLLLPTGSYSIDRMRCATSGSATILWISAQSRGVIGAGVPAGTKNPPQPERFARG